MWGGDKDLYVGVCYIPPADSRQLRIGKNLEDRFDTLLQHVAQASSMGHVVLGGDFNAKLGSLNEVAEDVSALSSLTTAQRAF